MNHPTIVSRHGHSHWHKDLQFAVGVMVAVGGAAVLVSEIIHLFA